MMIASRILKLRAAGNEVEIPVRIFAPERGERDAWSCRYEIEWPDGKRTMAAYGADAVQAMLLALQMIGSELYTSNYHKSGHLFLDRAAKGYGFPVPQSLRDLLEGDDAEYL